LIIDADLRRLQHQVFNLAVQPGLTDVIDGDVSFAKAAADKYQQPLGSNQANPLYSPHSFESERMRTSWQKLLLSMT